MGALGTTRCSRLPGWSMIAVALDFFLVRVARRLDFLLAWTIPEFLLPLAVPTSPDAILALDFPLELPALGFALHLARTVPELVLPLVTERRPNDAEADDHQDAQYGPRAHCITSAETLSDATGIAPVP
jgi:hypothetical protein